MSLNKMVFSFWVPSLYETTEMPQKDSSIRPYPLLPFHTKFPLEVMSKVKSGEGLILFGLDLINPCMMYNWKFKSGAFKANSCVRKIWVVQHSVSKCQLSGYVTYQVAVLAFLASFHLPLLFCSAKEADAVPGQQREVIAAIFHLVHKWFPRAWCFAVFLSWQEWQENGTKPLR